MIPVGPEERTTLITNAYHLSQGRFFTARACLRNVLNGYVKCVDAARVVLSAKDWFTPTTQLADDQPCMRSAPDPRTGEERRWPLPTVVIATRYFGRHCKNGESVPLRTLYKLQGGICQYCWNPIPFEEATRDHIYPKDLGGSNDSFNLVLACRRCNSNKGNTYPYHDVAGEIPKPVILAHVGIHLPDDLVIRDEWKPYLFK